MSYDLIALGNALKELRIKNDLTLVEVAEKMEVTHKAVQFWEQGKNEIKLSNLISLCKIYNVSVNDILNRAGI